MSYAVELTDGCVFRRHQDHMRYDAGRETSSSTECPMGRQATVDACPPVTLPEEEPLGEESVPGAEVGRSRTDPAGDPNTRATHSALLSGAGRITGSCGQVTACSQTS